MCFVSEACALASVRDHAVHCSSRTWLITAIVSILSHCCQFAVRLSLLRMRSAFIGVVSEMAGIPLDLCVFAVADRYRFN